MCLRCDVYSYDSSKGSQNRCQIEIWVNEVLQTQLHLRVTLPVVGVLCHFTTTLSTRPPSSLKDQSPHFERLDRSGPVVSDQSSSNQAPISLCYSFFSDDSDVQLALLLYFIDDFDK